MEVAVCPSCKEPAQLRRILGRKGRVLRFWWECFPCRWRSLSAETANGVAALVEWAQAPTGVKGDDNGKA